MIRKVTLESNFIVLADLLKLAFSCVAKEFKLTEENCSSNTAFITCEKLISQLTDYREFYCFEENNEVIGFIGIEKSLSEAETFYIEKVAVHPEFRNRGVGAKLMEFASFRIKQLGGKRISIGLINSNTKLKEWYLNQDYIEFRIKAYSHLPFDVCLMEKWL